MMYIWRRRLEGPSFFFNPVASAAECSSSSAMGDFTDTNKQPLRGDPLQMAPGYLRWICASDASDQRD